MKDGFIIYCGQHSHAEVRDFGSYFESTYGDKIEEWSLSLIDVFQPTTNMLCENFHKKLKAGKSFMNSVFNRRVDKLLWYLKLNKGSMIHRHATHISAGPDKTGNLNFKAHQAASKQSFDMVKDLENGWEVKSFENPEGLYKVEKTNHENCPYEKCTERCIPCGACWHLYKCTCDAANNAKNRGFSCKHVQLVLMKITEDGNDNVDQSENNINTQSTNQLPEVIRTSSPLLGERLVPGRSNIPLHKQKRK